MMDPGSIKPFYYYWQFWLQMIQLIGIAVIGIYTWWSNREKVSLGRFDKLEKEMTQRVTTQALENIDAKREARCALHQERTNKLEMNVALNRTGIDNLPGHANLAELHERVDEVHGRITAAQGQIANLSGQVKGMNHTVDLIHEWVLKERKP